MALLQIWQSIGKDAKSTLVCRFITKLVFFIYEPARAVVKTQRRILVVARQNDRFLSLDESHLGGQ